MNCIKGDVFSIMVSKKFLEAVSKDSALKSELEQATLAALGEFLKSKGLEEEAGKIAEAAMEKVAEAHGFKADEMTELSEDELEAVAGGVCACPVAGGGTGTGKACACAAVGFGTNDSGKKCACCLGGYGHDD